MVSRLLVSYTHIARPSSPPPEGRKGGKWRGLRLPKAPPQTTDSPSRIIWQVMGEPFPDLLDPKDYFKRPTLRSASDYKKPVSYDSSYAVMKRLMAAEGVRSNKVT